MEHYARPGSSILVACGVNSTTIQSGLVGLYYSSNRHMRANYGVQPKPVQVHIWMMTVPKTIKSEFLLLAFAPPYLGSCWSCRRLEFTLGPWFSFLDFSPDNSSCLTQSHTHTHVPSMQIPFFISMQCAQVGDWKSAKSIYEFSAKDIDGNETSLEKYR